MRLVNRKEGDALGCLRFTLMEAFRYHNLYTIWYYLAQFPYYMYWVNINNKYIRKCRDIFISVYIFKSIERVYIVYSVGPVGPGPKWAQGPSGPGPKWAQGPSGPGPKWARAQVG